MDVVEVLVLWVVGFSVLVFWILDNLDSIEESRRTYREADKSSDLFNDSESKTRIGSESSHQDEEKSVGAAEEAGKRVTEEKETGFPVSVRSEESVSCSGFKDDGCKNMGISEDDGEGEEGWIDDDWEGIERTELEKNFGDAVVFVGSESNADQIADVKLQLYGLQKVALEGPCHGSQPMALKHSARSKWNAWQKLGNMSRETAMEKYIEVLSKAVPNWQANDLLKVYIVKMGDVLRYWLKTSREICRQRRRPREEIGLEVPGALLPVPTFQKFPQADMLRLNLYCSIVPIPRQAKIDVSSSFSSVLEYRRGHGRIGVRVRALKDEMGRGKGGGAPGQSWDPGLEFEVPFEQRPVNEYSSLKDESLYSWAELGPGSFFLRLGGLWLVTFTVLGVPIAAASFNPSKDPLRFVLAAGTGTLFLVSLIVLRIYLGWSYVGDRLLSAVIPYEESGWYDGQMWVKPPEILARDRLLGSYKVKPVIKLLKQTLVSTGALLVAGVSLFIFATPVEDFIKTTFAQKDNPSDVSASKISTKFRKEELLRLPVDVRSDDDLAAAAAAAADGRPVYCRDRYYRALAGGQYCKWEDLLK
ncbi:UNVERIFIED_CONTAM: protein CONSERVED IN THE GREEN LINEAGE AND DIATOMS 27, chloroplastic [Sesamum radiatum]|uniref:Protein CONSERVED IN THE GREEN LINEAGE AND DIATOMS 27, chloroplastic n=1 Tax=Sesamum radiatum TaxID=300843 RepID=A0AAW2VQJ0_SESRA